MSAQTMDQKTTVFTFGSLAAEEPRSYDVDEPTRELPLIAGRFAGREWAVEDLQREYVQKKEARTAQKTKDWSVPAVSAAAAAVLLIGALIGQSGLVKANEEAAAVEREIVVLRQEQNGLRMRYAQSGLAFRVDDTDPDTVLVNREIESRDKATVLNVRRGHELQHLWNSFIDTLGESFR